ncbi:MAG: YhcH/YjgK/YiaL family protein, partial [Candidatus Cloacimonetes bacterium]|nr:YhcH/YjgK/YiaL family protein [Candidatus Cloacimonadota bacterium]
MIVAKLDALKTYSFLGENFSYIVDFINQEKLTDLSDGKFDLNDSIFYIVSSYQTKPQGLIENHQKYIDLQILLEGKELVGYKDLLNIKSVNYDNEND